MRPVLHLIPVALLLGAAACGPERSPGNSDDQVPPAARAIDAGEARAVRSLLSRGLGEEALGRARRLQAEHPQAADAHLLVGDALGTRGDFAGAAREYRKAASPALTEPVALRLAEALKRSNRDEDAAEVLRLFLEQNPDNPAALTLAGNGFMEAGDWRQAIRMYERVRRRAGDEDAVLLNNLAWAYLEEGDYDRALPLAEQAWSLDKANPATTDTLGWTLFRSGRDKARGLLLLEQASRAAPSDRQIQSHLQAARRG